MRWNWCMSVIHSTMKRVNAPRQTATAPLHPAIPAAWDAGGQHFLWSHEARGTGRKLMKGHHPHF